MTKRDRKYGSNTGSRAADGKFGQGNPGKPKGARHKATLAALELLDGEAEALTPPASSSVTAAPGVSFASGPRPRWQAMGSSNPVQGDPP